MSRYPKRKPNRRGTDAPVATCTRPGLTEPGLTGSGLTGPGLPKPQWLIDRRKMLALTTSAAALALVPFKAEAKPAPGRKFFTRSEYAILEKFTDMIIPSDEVSNGALAAKVPQIIDARIAEALDPKWRQSWRDDLAEIDRLSRAWNGRSFRRASWKQRYRVLSRTSRNEANPKKNGEFAFGTIKWEVCDIYYRTEIGIHQDLNYQGNVYLDEFIGTDVSGAAQLPAAPVPEAGPKPAAEPAQTSATTSAGSAAGAKPEIK